MKVALTVTLTKMHEMRDFGMTVSWTAARGEDTT